jgi:outer membrane receptor protein involved in Fe transport
VDIEDATFGDVDIAPAAAAGHLTARYGQRYQWIAAFNKGFRAPNINDLSTFGAFDSGIEVPVQSLKPEHSYTSEIGWRTTGEHLQVSVTGYYTWLVNLIVRAPATWQGNDSLDGDPVFQKQNIDRAFITGTEGKLVWQPARHWRLTQGLAWAYGQNLTRDEPLSRIPPLHGRTVLQYEPLPTTWIALEGLYATLQDRLSGGDTRDHRIPAGGTPGWAIANLRAGYSLRWLDLSAGLQNILNAAYRVHGSGVDGYGRSVWVSARFMW